MKKLRKRAIARLYGWKYHRWSNKSGYWSLRKLDKTYGFSSYVMLSEDEFLKKLKWYRKYDF